MKTASFSAFLTVSVLFAGCGEKASQPSSQTPAAAPAAQPAMIAWQQGDKSTAASRFVEADWSTGPLFPPGSTLSLSEAEFMGLSSAERQTKSGEMLSQIDSLKRLAAAVAEAGRDAASQGDTAQARKYFTSLQRCGTALDRPERLSLVQLVGRAFQKMADAELAKLPK